MYNIGNEQFLNPHCMKKLKKQHKHKNKTHICEILFILCMLVSYFQHKQNCENQDGHKHSKYHAIVVNSNYNISPILTLYVSKDRKVLNHQCKSLYISLLLLLLANDVHPNPGPKPGYNSCYTCKKEISNEYQLLQCQTCNKQYHTSCQVIKLNQKHKANNHFEWICYSKNCYPNYQKTQLATLTDVITQNRYHPLSEDVVHSNPTKPNTILLTYSELENLELFKELPVISPAEYEGKCLCRVCHKIVTEKNRAISCDMCEMWSHLKCSDMNIKLYNHLTFINNFKWSCIKCRSNELVIKEKIDLTKLNKNAAPEKFEQVHERRNETLILHLNCRSLLKKREELEYIIAELKPTIVCLTETWFDASVAQSDFVPEGYKILRHDRSDNFKQKYGKVNGGGVAILYKQNIKIQKVNDLTDPVEEILWIRIKTKFSFLLGVIYRADYTDTLQETLEESLLENNIRRACETAKSVVLLGDFNINYAKAENHLRDKLENVCATYGLSQVINKPTRIDPNTGSQTIIDHVWINKEYVPIKDSGTTIGISDHLATYVKLNQTVQQEAKTIISRDFKKYDPEVFCTELHESLGLSDLHEIINKKDVNTAMEKLSNIIIKTLDKFAPITERKIQIRYNPIPWLNEELRNIIARKNSMLKDFYQFGLQSLKNPIKILNNKIVHLKRTLKKKYLSDELSDAKNDPKKTWKIINNIIGSKSQIDSAEPDMMTQDKADSYNKFFAQIGEEILMELNLNIPVTDLKGHEGFSFSLESEENIGKLIDQMKSNVATGRDGIGVKVIKDAKTILTPWLTKIVNISYSTNTFPDCMKKASIRPIHKKEDSNFISNYRPISILPCLSKVFERSASNQLIVYLEKNNKLNASQHAYRKQHGTQTCLFQVINHVQKLMDEGKFVAIVSLDLSKAFDAINHEMLLKKLIKLGLSETALCWIKSYLSKRVQCTRFSNFTSKDEEVKAGVPQGSILGPLLFICFSNDIYTTLEEQCKALSYADDSQLIIAAKNQKELILKIENIIKVAHDWYTANCMKANQGKTEILVINRGNLKTENIKIKVKEKGKRKILTPSKYIKVLGVLIDENLSWKKQVLKVKKTATNTIRKLHRINHLLPMDIKIQLYNALVVPHFDYADVIWGGCSVEMCRKLQITQNFAVKSITGAKKYDHASASYEKLKFLDLQQRRNIHEVVFTHKSLLHHHPSDICKMYLELCPTSNTRSSHSATLNYPPHSTTKYEKSPLYRSVESWNSIPNYIATNTTTKVFKREFQKNLIQKTFTMN